MKLKMLAYDIIELEQEIKSLGVPLEGRLKERFDNLSYVLNLVSIASEIVQVLMKITRYAKYTDCEYFLNLVKPILGADMSTVRHIVESKEYTELINEINKWSGTWEGKNSEGRAYKRRSGNDEYRNIMPVVFHLENVFQQIKNELKFDENTNDK